MPLKLKNPKSKRVIITQDVQILDIDITRINIDLFNKEITITYREGYDNGEEGVLYIDKTEDIRFSDEKFLMVFGRNPKAYSALKEAVYNELMAELNLEGDII